MSERQYFGSRYAIKYHPNTQRFSFYLSGASYENRQEHYAGLTGFLQELRGSEQARFNINDNIWQDIATDSINFELKHEKTTGYLRVKAKPKPEFIDTWREYFDEDQIDLGLVPKDKEFAGTLMKYYRQLPLTSRRIAVKLHNMKFNAWEEGQNLLGMQFSTVGLTVNLPTTMTVVNSVTAAEPVVRIPVQTIETKPQIVMAETIEALIRTSCANFASMFMMEKMSGI